MKPLAICALIYTLMLTGCHATHVARPAESGLVITDLVAGSGAKASPGDTLIVHYEAWLAANDATPFDSSYGREPFRFILGTGQVIRGWDLGMIGARAGGTRRLELVPEMAYGAAGYPPLIPPNSSTVFNIRLIELRAARRQASDSWPR